MTPAEIAAVQVSQQMVALGYTLIDGAWWSPADLMNKRAREAAAAAAVAPPAVVTPTVNPANEPPYQPPAARDVTQLLGGSVSEIANPTPTPIPNDPVKIQTTMDVAALSNASAPTFYLPTVESSDPLHGESNAGTLESDIKFTSNHEADQRTISRPNGRWTSESREEQDWEFAAKKFVKKGRKKRKGKK